jgi:uncharacterized protein
MLPAMKRALAFALLAALSCQQRHHVDPAYEKQIMDWRAHRAERLKSEDSWLSLIGLDWLHEGENPLTLAGATRGDVTLHKGVATLVPTMDSDLTIDGKPVSAPTVLRDDGDGATTPTVVQLGTIRFNVIKRIDRYALRIKDANAPTRVHFVGLDYFPVNPKWRLVAHFEPYNPPRHVKITNVLGMVSDEIAPGQLRFEVDGQAYRIEPILEKGEKDWFLIFKDATSGHETYGAARYLYASPPGADGTTVLDFNKAYNPPCAFTPFATCPLPPAQNRLPLRIDAGELKYRGGHA